MTETKIDEVKIKITGYNLNDHHAHEIRKGRMEQEYVLYGDIDKLVKDFENILRRIST